MHVKPRYALAAAALAATAGVAILPARAEPALDIAITIKDHKFAPSTLNVPAGTAIKLTVNNLDATPEEFESYHLQFEKIIAGNQSAVIRIKPLSKGTYNFFGDYHQATAQGEVVAE